MFFKKTTTKVLYDTFVKSNQQMMTVFQNQKRTFFNKAQNNIKTTSINSNTNNNNTINTFYKNINMNLTHNRNRILNSQTANKTCKRLYNIKTKQKRGKHFFIAIPFLTFGLGTWQVQRYFWKQNLIKDINQNSKGM